jgi:hypothetical protein
MSDSEPKRYKMRATLLQDAERVITQDRNKNYGEPDEDFRRIAQIASGMGFRMDTGGGELRELQGADVSLFMIALKVSRLVWSPEHRDSWMDIAGYAACGFETASLAKTRVDDFFRDLDAAPPEAEPVEEDGGELSSGLRGPELIRAGREAVKGNPDDLESMALFLMDLNTDPDQEMIDSQICYRTGHTFQGDCRYRIHHRRTT